MTAQVASGLPIQRNWKTVRAKFLFERQRRLPRIDDPVVTVFRDGVVTRRSNRREEGFTNAIQEVGYQGIREGDLVVHGMDAFAGSIGVSDSDGKSTPVYLVYKSSDEIDARFYAYWLRSLAGSGYILSLAKGIRERSSGFDHSVFSQLVVPVPPREEQRAIADNLDHETTRIDAALGKRTRLLQLLEERDLSLAWQAITGANLADKRRSVEAQWLGSLPASWPLASVSSQFEVQLGRMLNPERAAGPNPAPYVRNANVRWDFVDVSNLAQMDFPPAERRKYQLKAGDVLINEGGAGMGRTAIWQGEVAECFFQKSVLRLRPRGWSNPRWIVECMRIAVAQALFLVEGNVATIPHLPAESLRVQRFPFPPRHIQDRQLEWLTDQRGNLAQGQDLIRRQNDLLRERRQTLITAAVTGRLAEAG